MNFLRRVGGCIRRSRLRNDDIRIELNTEPLVLIIRYYRQRRCADVERMEDNRTKEVGNCQLADTRSSGRARKRWTPEQQIQPNLRQDDDDKDDLKKRQLSIKKY